MNNKEQSIYDDIIKATTSNKIQWGTYGKLVVGIYDKYAMVFQPRHTNTIIGIGLNTTTFFLEISMTKQELKKIIKHIEDYIYNKKEEEINKFQRELNK